MEPKEKRYIFESSSESYKKICDIYFEVLAILKRIVRVDTPYGALSVEIHEGQLAQFIVAGRIYQTSFVTDLVNKKMIGRITLTMRPIGVAPDHSVLIAKIEYDSLGNIASMFPKDAGDPDVGIADESNCENIFTEIIAHNLTKSFEETVQESEIAGRV